MSRRSQDIPIRPRYGYADEAGGEDAASSSHKQQQRNNACGTPASYSEIPFLAQYAGPVPEHVLQDITPTAGKVPPPGSESYMNLDSGEDDDHDDDDEEEEDEEEPSNSNSKDSSNEPSKPTNRPKSLQSTFPYELEGSGDTSSTGAMHHFVAHNLESKLRATTDHNNSEQTTPSAPISRFLQSRNVPEVDGNVLSDIELEAQYLATSVDNLMENLGNLLHSISSITADNVEVHKNAVKKLTDALDANIKCQYQLLAKTEEISKSMRPTEKLSQRIREIKRLVDMLDSTM
ncbi:BLOC-1-related complex subunit 6 isoform X1 [Drosophila virilis]|uniref:BLOC-1-related complex subunit 6 C-terminal helix domain-containing protein n=2 Tax=Drosophila virilis TaxID=7244 RepID=B4LCV7_DROVI|nr:BLOC-1-related complex subunit 6 [Drosophila virilis]EDW68818.1 uncharacterized protein Dvir_GJ12911 [Drosophila virilis]